MSYHRLAEHNRLVGARHLGLCGVLCDMCGAEMEYDQRPPRSSQRLAAACYPVGTPVRCPGCRYTGVKAGVSETAVADAITAALEPVPVDPPPS